MIKKIKEFFSKISAKQWLIGIVTIILIIIIGALLYINKSKDKVEPVATEEPVKTVNDVSNGGKEYDKIVSQVNGNKDNDAGFKYRFQTQTKEIKEDDKKEFQTSEQFQRNLMRLIQSGKASDINQAAAIWTKNKENYNFTNKENLLTAGIGHDILIYEDYFEVTDGLPVGKLGAFQKKLGVRIKNDFKTPMTMAVIGSQLLPQGQKEFLTDSKSNLADYSYTGVEYLETKQFKKEEDIKDSKAKLPQGNILEEIFKNYNNINSVYEVHLSNKYNKESYAYIIEDPSGKLEFYGVYYTNVTKTDPTLGDYRKQIAEFGETDEATEEDLNWSNFVNSLNNNQQR